MINISSLLSLAGDALDCVCYIESPGSSYVDCVVRCVVVRCPHSVQTHTLHRKILHSSTIVPVVLARDKKCWQGCQRLIIYCNHILGCEVFAPKVIGQLACALLPAQLTENSHLLKLIRRHKVYGRISCAAEIIAVHNAIQAEREVADVECIAQGNHLCELSRSLLHKIASPY